MVAIDRDALRRAIDEHHRAVQQLRRFLAARRAEEDPH
jgi:CRP-like cAMP-binding protein